MKQGGKIFSFRIISGLVLLGAIILDRFLKVFVESAAYSGPYGWRWLAFERFHNTGVAFGTPIPLWIVLPLTAVFLFFCFVWWKRTQNQFTRATLAFIVVGALSNAFDRALFGYTVDYLRIINGIINLADGLIAVGLIFLLKEGYDHKRL